MKITLKDGSVKEVKQGISVLELAKEISEGLARMATCAKVNGKVRDLRYEINEDSEVEICTFENSEDGKKAYWHTTAHIMAQAIKRIYGDNIKLTIGPAIDKGFYYDFDVKENISSDDFEKIEAEMKKIIKEDLPIERFSLPRDEAIKFMKERGEDYKVELIEELPEGEEISFYKQGEFTDLCAGPHLMSTGKVKAVKILSSSGAYWRGDEHNKMLQRFYGISYPKASQLEEYLNMLEEAKKRDHKKLGKELELFMIAPEGPGFPFFLPKGMVLRNVLEDFWRDIHRKNGYVEIKFSVKVKTTVAPDTEIKNSAIANGKTSNEVITKVDEATVSVPVSKEIVSGESDAAKAYPISGAVVTLNGTDGSTQSVTLNDQNGYKYEFTNLPKYDAQGNEITYTAEESAIEEEGEAFIEYLGNQAKKPKIIHLEDIDHTSKAKICNILFCRRDFFSENSFSKGIEVLFDELIKELMSTESNLKK